MEKLRKIQSEEMLRKSERSSTSVGNDSSLSTSSHGRTSSITAMKEIRSRIEGGYQNVRVGAVVPSADSLSVPVDGNDEGSVVSSPPEKRPTLTNFDWYDELSQQDYLDYLDYLVELSIQEIPMHSGDESVTSSHELSDDVTVASPQKKKSRNKKKRGSKQKSSSLGEKKKGKVSSKDNGASLRKNTASPPEDDLPNQNNFPLIRAGNTTTQEEVEESVEYPASSAPRPGPVQTCSIDRSGPIPFNDDFEQLMKDPIWFTSITSAHTNNSVTDPSSDRNNLSEATSSIDQSNLSEVTSSIDQNHLSGVTSSIDQDNLSEVISSTDQNEQSKVISSTDQKKDETALIAKNDEVICLFGSEIIQNHLQFNQLRQVATRMRELARLLVKLRKLDKSITSLSDALFPSKFKFIVEATRELCRYDEMSGKVDVISMPTRIGTSIKLCIQLNMCRIIENESTPQDVALSAQRDAELMQTLFSNRWAFNVSSNAEKSKKRRDASKSQIIADNNDVKLFTEYLEDQLLHHYSELQLGQDLFPNFEKLCKILIALIIIYNRRRAGEAARIELHYYVNRDLRETNKEIFNSMSSSQQAAAKMFSSFQILGKRTRRVPVLITKNMERAIDRLIELRSQVAISENNPYLFPKLYSENPHDGTKILQELRSKIKLKNPTALTSRGLRTNIATMSAVCNIDSQKKKNSHEL
ncbi:unnamed protein product [Bemisia tabaci]|uniref:Uncharacterized protein n=1 Tax=Bemisia tabaci TaxID=7038 RepID=A0A9P0AHP0_BEMTA|nr:unnamed protein product [Bemisia tabaci]